MAEDKVPKGAIFYNDKNEYLFTVEGTKKLKREMKALSEEPIAIHTRIRVDIDDLISELDYFEKCAFSGIVIPEQVDEDGEAENEPKDEIIENNLQRV